MCMCVCVLCRWANAKRGVMHVDKLARFPRRFQHATRRPRVPFMFGPRCFWWKLDKKRVGHWRFLVLGKPPWHDIFFVCEAVVRNRICVDIFFDDAGMPHVFQTGHTAVRLKVPRVIWINFGLGADSSIALCLIWIPFPHFKEQWRISTSEKGLGQIDRTDRKNAELNAETSWQSNSIWNSKHVETVCVQSAKPKLYWYLFRSQRFCNYGNMSISHWINIFFHLVLVTTLVPSFRPWFWGRSICCWCCWFACGCRFPRLGYTFRLHGNISGRKALLEPKEKFTKMVL